MRNILILLIILSSLSFFMIFGIFYNYRTYSFLRQLDLEKASQTSKKAILLPKFLNLITFGQVDSIKLWNFLLEEIPNLKNLKEESWTYVEQVINGEEAKKETLEKITKNLEKINSELNKIDIKQLNEITEISNDSLIIAKKILSRDQKYIVILQNSDEIRASGGFLGSFFILEIKNGQIYPIKIQDIYAPDGQYKGFIEAPKGLAEYLSSGKGMRLQDSNWYPNFPDSAEQILYFFENIETINYDGLISINLNLVEKLLEITGEIYLPDYGKSVNQYNFAQIAREDRNEFFPGSQEKANFLNHFLKIFKLQLAKSIQKKPSEFLILTKKLIKNKDLQFYSRDQETEAILKKRKMAGIMQDNDQDLYYFLVESNVGINKTNKLVERQVEIKIAEEEKITINFQNNNFLPYVNYQRLYLKKDAQLISVFVDDQEITKIDQKIINDQWLEIGFLAPVLARNQSKIEITIKNKLDSEKKRNVFIQKQSGLQSTPYTVSYQEQSQDFELTSDQSLIFD